MNQISPILMLLVSLLLIIGSFLLLAYLIMLTYNNSIPKMNSNWKLISYKTALIFTLFTIFVFHGSVVQFTTTN